MNGVNSMRISKKVLEAKLDTINAQLKTNDKPYEYALDWAYGGVKLVKLNKEYKSESEIHGTRLTKKELNTVMEAIININFIEIKNV